MGFFAVLKEPDQPRFTVKKLDINVWCLPGLFARNILVCDVGLRLQSDNEFDQFALGIPFGTTEGGLEDLVPLMQDSPATTGLVFGRPCVPTPRDGRVVVDHGTGPMSLAFVDVGKTTYDEGRSNQNFSLWHLHVNGTLPADMDSYLRMRFAVDSLGRAWTWRRSLLVRRNATVDLRVCDLRETQTLPDGNNYEQQVVAINQLNCFVITPASFRTSRASPQTRYVRLLEGRVWESYLRRATDLRRSAKLVINYWRSEGEVNTLNEFRAFLDLRREGWTELLAMFTLALMAVLAGVALLSAPAELAESPVVKFAEDVWSLTGLHITLGVGAIVALLLGAARLISSLLKRWQWLRHRLRAAESAIYRFRGKLD
jgi:hypothetical protein